MFLFYVYQMKKLLFIILISVFASCEKHPCGHISKVYIPYSKVVVNGKIHVVNGRPHIAIYFNGKEIERAVTEETYLKIKNDSIEWWCF